MTCRVHQANKLAAKHDRVDLSRGAEVSQCDICQDRPAVLFCSEDRALICRRWGTPLEGHQYMLAGGCKSCCGCSENTQWHVKPGAANRSRVCYDRVAMASTEVLYSLQVCAEIQKNKGSMQSTTYQHEKLIPSAVAPPGAGATS